MDIKRERHDRTEIFRFDGQWVMRGVKEARSVIMPSVADESISKILIDFHGVEMIDSSAIGFLIACHKEMKGQGGVFAIFNCNDLILSILKSARVDDIIIIFGSEAEALS